jgi:two-component system cell cycle response regulator DivK
MSGTVLVVEDNAMNMKLLEQALDVAGYRIVGSADGANLVELAVNSATGLILMDIQLPRLSGVDLLKQLRADPRTATVPVFAVTAYADTTSVAGFLGQGFDQVITKPISIRHLLDQVARNYRAPDEP